MSVNSIAGLPIFEVFANNTIIAGQYNSGDFTISGNKVGIGNKIPLYTLDVSGTVRITGIPVSTSTNTLVINSDATVGTKIDSFISGTTNRISKFTSSINLGNSLLSDDGTGVGLTTINSSSRLNIDAGTTGLAPLGFTAGSAALLTTVGASKLEYDANSFYLTSNQLFRGAIERLIYATSTLVTVNTTTADQTLIGAASQSWMTLTMPVGAMVVGRTLRFYARGRIIGGGGVDSLKFTFKYGSNFSLFAPSSASISTFNTTSREWDVTLILTCLSTTTATACTFGPTTSGYQYGRITLGNDSTTTTTAMAAYGLRHHATANTNDTFDNTVTNAIGFTVSLTAGGTALTGSVDCSSVSIGILN
jgi:hypothetical protein